MQHMSRDANYTTVLKALEEEEPGVARAMVVMSDCVSAAVEIISNQLGAEYAEDPTNVIPMAMSMFEKAASLKAKPNATKSIFERAMESKNGDD